MSDHERPSVDDVVRELRRGAAGTDPGGAGGRDGRHRRAAPAGDQRSGPAPARRPGRSGRRRLLVLGAVLSCALLVGALWHRGSTPSPTVDSGQDTSWSDVVVRLDHARVAAWESGSAAALRAADAPGSAAERADTATLSAFAAAGARPRGVRLVVDHVGVVSTAASRVVLRVVDRRPAYELVDASGTVTARVQERGPAAWEVELHRLGDAWRLAEARPLSSP